MRAAAVARVGFRWIIVLTGVCVTVYSFVGGIVAVIWADAVQAIVLMAGAVICPAVMLFGVDGGPPEVFRMAVAEGKFSLGPLGAGIDRGVFWWDVGSATVIVVRRPGFPHFIAKHLPPGLPGLLFAAIFAAAMSTVSTSLNSSATLLMSDYYRRFVNRQATEGLRVGPKSSCAHSSEASFGHVGEVMLESMLYTLRGGRVV